jgi:ATP-binding cassette subfamily C protein
MTTAAIRKLAEGGVEVPLAVGRPLLLSDPEQVLLVLSGRLDLFLVNMEQGKPAGSRFHLLRVEEGQAVFGMKSASYAGQSIVATGAPGTKLVGLSLRETRSRASKQPADVSVLALLEDWIGAIADAAGKPAPPRRFLTLEPGVEASTGDSAIALLPRRGIVWARHIAGQSHYLGNEEIAPLGPDGYFPVSRSGWLLAAPESRLQCVDSASFSQSDPEWHGLRAFHDVAFASFVVNRLAAAQQERDRLHAKAQADAGRVDGSLAMLGAPLGQARDEAAGHETDSGDPLLAASRIVGRHLGIEIKPHRGAREGNRFSDPVAAMARASGVRVRRVVLKGSWWKRDSGPMLAFTEDGNRPVALIPHGHSSYRLVDPSTSSGAAVGRRSALSLSGAAYVFYRSFPARELNAVDILRFGMRGCEKDIGAIFAIGALSGLLGLAVPILTGILFDSVIPGAQRDRLIHIAAILVVTAFSSSLFTLTRNFAVLRLEGRMDAFVQAAVWDRLLSLPAPFFRDYTSGDLATRAMGINSIRRQLTGITLSSILSSVFSVFSFALLFYYSVTLALLATVLVGIALVVTTVRGLLRLKYQRELSAIAGKISGMVLEFVNGIAKFRVSGTEDRAFAVWAAEFAKQKRVALDARRISNSVAVFNSAFPVISSAGVFYVTAGLIDQPGTAALTTGSFLAFSAAFGQFMGATLDVGGRLVGLLSIVPLYERAKPILQRLPEVDLAKHDPGHLHGGIEVNHISFRYREDGPLVLRDTSLSIEPGQFVAIVGASGSGKSTLVRLLLGFERAESGAVYYDGQDLAGLDVQSVRRQIGTVLQNGRIVDGDIFANIIGSKALTMEDAWEAARMSGLDRDIEAMPMGMHTFVSNEGGGLSGGQRQRLMIARAIVSKPRILFFDEATSALDNQTQAAVSRSLEGLKTTRVVIAHRLSTIRKADKIVVLDKGAVVQVGSYDELIEREGLFADLAKRQIA